MTRAQLTTVVAVILAASLPEAQSAKFEVVSVKASSPTARAAVAPLAKGERLLMTNTPIRGLIYFAYFPIESREIVGGPDWMHKDRYDVEAVAASAVTVEGARLMARQLLEDRFKLKAHVEKQERPVLTLVVSKPGEGVPKGLVRSTLNCDELIATWRSNPSPPKPPRAANGEPGCMSSAGTEIRSGGITMADLAERLTAGGIGMVLDRTGLPGRYEFVLRYSKPTVDSVANPPDDRPVLTTALQEQLGLKLVPDRAPLDVVVVDSIERPTPN